MLNEISYVLNCHINILHLGYCDLSIWIYGNFDHVPFYAYVIDITSYAHDV